MILSIDKFNFINYNVLMRRNKEYKMSDFTELSDLIKNLQTSEEVHAFLSELLTENEILTLSKRWRILKLLSQGVTQREIASQLQVGLCKVTRGAKILKNKDSVITKNLIKEK